MYVPENFLIKEFCMKNVVKLFVIIALIAVVGFSMAAQEIEKREVTTTGRLTITGLSAYEGWKIYADIEESQGIHEWLRRVGYTLHALESATNMQYPDRPLPGDEIYGTVRGGQVVLKVFKRGSGNTYYYQSYTGNDRAELLVHLEGDEIMTGGTVTVVFSNGIARGAFVPWPW